MIVRAKQPKQVTKRTSQDIKLEKLERHIQQLQRNVDKLIQIQLGRIIPDLSRQPFELSDEPPF